MRMITRESLKQKWTIPGLTFPRDYKRRISINKIFGLKQTVGIHI
jgi:hypothetical protein